MHSCVRLAAQAVMAVALGGGISALAIADDFEAHLVACPANKTAIGEVGSCGKIWKLKSGKAKLDTSGRLEVEVKGLVLNDASVGEFNGTPDGVDGVAAAVLCSGPSGAAVAFQSEVTPLSKSGEARIKAKISLSGACVAPVIVLRERYDGKIGGWLAATGI